MVVQAVEQKDEPIEFIDIPDSIPNEIIENDSLLTIESNMNKLEDKIVITARSVLSLTREIKSQLFEIERLEKSILSMHNYMVDQSLRIEGLETEVENLCVNQSKINEKEPGRGFWARLFSIF